MQKKQGTTEAELAKKKERNRPSAMEQVGAYGVTGKKSSFTVKRILAVLGVIVLVAVLGLVVYQVVKEKYTDAIDAQMELINNRETQLEPCLESSVGGMKKEFVMEYGQLLSDIGGKEVSWEKNVEDIFSSQYEEFEKSFGENFQVSYEVVSEKQLSELELKTYGEDIRDYLSNGIGKVQEELENDRIKKWAAESLTELFEKWYKKYSETKATDGYSVIVNVTYSSGSEEKVVPVRMIVVRMDGEWIVRVGGLVNLDSAKIFENMTY